MKVVEQTLSEKEAEEAVKTFSELKAKKDKVDKKFEQAKANFYKQMGSFLDANSDCEDNFWFDDESGNVFSATRFFKTKVTFHPEKVKEILPDFVDESEVITKIVTILDWDGFSKLLKAHGVKFSEVLPLINVQKEVSKDAIDQLVETGVIKKEDLAGTYEVTVGKPQFRVTVKRAEDGTE